MEPTMDRTFDYAQKIFLAVEIAAAPRRIADLPASYTVFQRVGIPEVVHAFAESTNLAARLLAGHKFQSVLDQRMGYWEQRVGPGLHGFVHYAIGPAAEIDRAFERERHAAGWSLAGVYHVEPQASGYPVAFPTGAAPMSWNLPKTRRETDDSIYWFNFFPDQPLLFEKTFAVWLLFNISELEEGGECNQLTASDGPDRLHVAGVDPFVQVNLNRFTSLRGYFQAAREAGKHSFTDDPDYHWYGMLLRRLAAAA
jgi:hypothetical protein